MSETFSIEVLSRDERALTASVTPLASAPCFDGHFPGDPVLPGVAQLCELALPLARDAWPALPALRRVTRLKFHRLVRPGEALTLTLTRRAPTRVDFELTRDGEPVSAGAMDFGDLP